MSVDAESLEDAAVSVDDESVVDDESDVDDESVVDDEVAVEPESPHPTSSAATKLTLINVANTFFFIFCPPLI